MAVKVRKQTRPAEKLVQIAENISITEKQHAALLEHIDSRLEFGCIYRDEHVSRFEIIDKEIAGYIRLDPEDLERERDNILGKGPKVTDSVLPLTYSQLHEALTFIMSVFAPDEGMYSATASASNQKLAKAFAKQMNNTATVFDHFTNLMLGIFDGLKYNLGGYLLEWDRIIGPKINIQSAGNIKFDEEVLHAGNKIQAIDMYNLIYDITVSPTMLAEKGEFFALVEPVSLFKLHKLNKLKQIYNIDKALKNNMLMIETTYYKRRPEIHIDHSGRGKSPDFISILSLGQQTHKRLGGAEEITYFGWLNPKEFGLSKVDEYQIWRITVINCKYIVNATHLNNVHGMLPIAMLMPLHDGFGTQTKSFAEQLASFQRFASFQMNVHQRAARKKLYGLTFYDESLIDLSGVDPVAATQPTKQSAMSSGTQIDLKKAVLHFTDAPDTNNTLQDIDAVITLMQKVLPTDMLKQVAGLERATQYQAAAVVQSANRRNYLIARTIDAQAFQRLKFMMYFNVVQFLETFTVLLETGEEQEIAPSDVAKMQLLFGLTGGLKGIDKLIIHELLRDVVNMVLQSQRASQEIDIVALVDYFTSLIGDNTDFNQFRFKNEFDKLTPEQKQLAFQLLQQAAAQQENEGGGPALPNPRQLAGLGA